MGENMIAKFMNEVNKVQRVIVNALKNNNDVSNDPIITIAALEGLLVEIILLMSKTNPRVITMFMDSLDAMEEDVKRI